MRPNQRAALKQTPEGIAHRLAADCIVTRALERYIYQVLEFVYEDMVAPRDARIAELEAMLAARPTPPT